MKNVVFFVLALFSGGEGFTLLFLLLTDLRHRGKEYVLANEMNSIILSAIYLTVFTLVCIIYFRYRKSNKVD